MARLWRVENDGTGMNVGPIAVKKKERRGQWKGKLHSEPASFLPPLTLSLWRFIPIPYPFSIRWRQPECR